MEILNSIYKSKYIRIRHLEVISNDIKIEDRVYDVRFGNGVVKSITGDKYYPIQVYFPKIDNIHYYCKDGRYCSSDVNCCLFKGNFEEDVDLLVMEQVR